jgi:hypothetical protein
VQLTVFTYTEGLVNCRLANHFGFGRMWANQRPARPFPEAIRPELLVPAQPKVIGVPRDPEVPTGHGDVASNLLHVLDDGESSSCSPG